MLTDRQINKLSSDFLMHDALFEWSRHYACEREWDSLTETQQNTLLQLADMKIKEQQRYCIIDDVLVESTTNKRLYALIDGEWTLRTQVKYNKKIAK